MKVAHYISEDGFSDCVVVAPQNIKTEQAIINAMIGEPISIREAKSLLHDLALSDGIEYIKFNNRDKWLIACEKYK